MGFFTFMLFFLCKKAHLRRLIEIEEIGKEDLSLILYFYVNNIQAMLLSTCSGRSLQTREAMTPDSGITGPSHWIKSWQSNPKSATVDLLSWMGTHSFSGSSGPTDPGTTGAYCLSRRKRMDVNKNVNLQYSLPGPINCIWKSQYIQH